jgi:hypothetical protein
VSCSLFFLSAVAMMEGGGLGLDRAWEQRECRECRYATVQVQSRHGQVGK